MLFRTDASDSCGSLSISSNSKLVQLDYRREAKIISFLESVSASSATVGGDNGDNLFDRVSRCCK